LSNIVANRIDVVIGDANGADKAMQSYFAEQKYDLVTVYCAGSVCRNNVGSWEVESINVPSNVRGREFYTAKDLEMARRADYGLILWDGSSSGSIANANELLRDGKSVRLYHSKRDEFYTLKALADLENVIGSNERAEISIDKAQAADLVMDGRTLTIRLPEGISIPAGEMRVRIEGKRLVLEPLEQQSGATISSTSKSVAQKEPKAAAPKRKMKAKSQGDIAPSKPVATPAAKRKKKTKSQISDQLALEIE
jgi:virulence-associated protein VagC